jgi:fatty-acyl-CoA synthase
MTNLSSFIAFHPRQTPGRCALKYRGEQITSSKVLKRVLRAELETNA